MNRRSIAAVVVFSVAVLAASLSVHAQNSSGGVVSKIPFEFVVGDKTFPAGDYRLIIQPRNVPALQIQSTDGKFHAALSPITRLARQHHEALPSASYVFDKVGDKRYLSEVWVPGQDGYLVHETKGKEPEEHEVVDVK